MSYFVISPGPGHIDRRDAPHGIHAFVGLTLEYLNMAPSDTRAMLHLMATDADEGFPDTDIGCELTGDDLRLLRDTIDALLTAIAQDEEEATWTTT